MAFDHPSVDRCDLVWVDHHNIADGELIEFHGLDLCRISAMGQRRKTLGKRR